ncbi:TPA: hypothetical protein ACTW9A_002562 [Raoultella planticola]|uniref:Uncharacterized protein n=1 Tax=Raoultella planticola TaxID=575 RepID=A0A443VEP3_RAOPL|nr:hypothetical protein [Raoultella planticola]RWT15374.1 hypothetical protein DN603_27850 [Raoultella planticola]
MGDEKINKNQLDSRKLIYTKQGERWLSQFDALDQETAKLLLNSLTLVSHTEFRRNLEALILDVSTKIAGPVALYAVRELKKKHDKGQLFSSHVVPFFDQVIKSNNGKM